MGVVSVSPHKDRSTLLSSNLALFSSAGSLFQRKQIKRPPVEHQAELSVT